MLSPIIDERAPQPIWHRILLASFVLHALFFTAAVRLPQFVDRATPERDVVVTHTPLYFPRLTQKAPNSRTPSKTIDIAGLLATERQQRQDSAPPPSHRHFELPATGPVVPTAQAKIAGPTPQIQAQPLAAAPSPLPDVTPPPAPPGARPAIAIPKATVQSAIQSLAPSGAGRHVVLGDENPTAPLPGATGSAGQSPVQHASVELESDPLGADLREYLLRALTIIRANWRRVLPESARLGTVRGRTTIQLVLDRDGRIPKLVVADPSGSDALDRAAVAGVSMSNPLPPLPADFKGEQVKLAFTFACQMSAE